MSEEEMYAMIGRTMSRYAEEKRQNALLMAKLRSLGETLSSVGRLLRDLPSPTSIEPLAAWQAAKKAPMIDTAQIVALLDEYHTRRQTVTELRQQLSEFGITEPDR